VELFIITTILLLLCVAGLGIRIWIKGEFAETEIGHNKHMQKLGIKCTKDEELSLHGKGNNEGSCSSCAACSFITKCFPDK